MPRKFWFGLILALLTAVGAVGPAGAQEDPPSAPGIRIEAEYGYDSIVKTQQWVPLTINIANNGPSINEAEIWVEDIDQPIVLPVSLPTQSNRRLTMNVFSSSVVGSSQIILRDGDGERIAVAQTGRPDTLDADGMLYLAVSSNPNALDFLDDVTAGRPEAAVAFLSPDDLPETGALLKSVDVLIFHDVDSSRLSAAQRTAVREWTELGGQLTFTGGVGWRPTTAAFEDLLPVDINGTLSVNDILGLEAAIQEPARDPGPYTAADAALRPGGSALINNGDRPVLAVRQYGEGHVYFLAFDPQFAPLDDWDGSPLLWGRIAEQVSRPLVWTNGFNNFGQLETALGALPELQPLSGWIIFAFLLTYILVIGPGNYFVLRARGRREMAWVSIPATILLFCAVAYVVGMQYKGNLPVLRELTVLSGMAGADTGRAYTAVGIYSPNRDGYEFELPPDTLVRSGANFNTFGADDWIIEQGLAPRIRGLSVNVGSLEMFTTYRHQPPPAVAATTQLMQVDGGLEVRVRVTNNTDKILERATLLIADRSIRLGDLAPGATQTQQEALPTYVEPLYVTAAQTGRLSYTAVPTSSFNFTASPLEVFYNDLVSPGATSYDADREIRTRYNLLDALHEDYNGDPVWTVEGAVYLVAWMETEPAITLDTDRSYEHSSQQVIFLRVPYEQ